MAFKDGEHGCMSFDSYQSAARYVGGHASNIIAVVRGKNKTAYGYKWALINEI